MQILFLLSVTPHTIFLDGNPSDWQQDEILENVTFADSNPDPDTAFGVTWDLSYVYFLITGIASNNDYFLYLDFNSSGASDVPAWGRVFSTGDSFPPGFAPDAVLCIWIDPLNNHGEEFYIWNTTVNDWSNASAAYLGSSVNLVYNSTTGVIEIAVDRGLLTSESDSFKVVFYGDNKVDTNPWKLWLVHPWWNFYMGSADYPLVGDTTSFKDTGFFDVLVRDGLSPAGSIILDGSPSEWSSEIPTSANSAIVNSNSEVVWLDELNDFREEAVSVISPSDTDYLDLVEFRISGDPNYLVGEIAFSFMNFTEVHPVVIIGIDAFPGGNVDFPLGVDTGSSGSDADFYLILRVDPFSGTPNVFVDPGSGPVFSRTGMMAYDNFSSTLEFKIAWHEIGIDPSALGGFDASFQVGVAYLENATDVYELPGSDFVDVVSIYNSTCELEDGLLDTVLVVSFDASGSPYEVSVECPGESQPRESEKLEENETALPTEEDPVKIVVPGEVVESTGGALVSGEKNEIHLVVKASPGTTVRVDVFDILGEKISSKEYVLDASVDVLHWSPPLNLPTGVYVVVLKNLNTGEVMARKKIAVVK